MTKLQELIEQLCPDGVNYYPIPEIFNTRNGYTPSKANTEFWNNGTVPWFRMEDIRENGPILSDAIQHVSEAAIKGELFPENSIIVATSATIGQHALITVPSLANQRFTYLMLKDKWKDSFDIKFLFYYCYKLDEFCLAHINQGNFASVDMKQFASFQFPVPPLDVQLEIVRILDAFTESTAELSIELSAELEAREKQYEYYKNKLLDFSDRVPVVRIGEITRVFSAARVHREDWTSSGVPFFRSSDVVAAFNEQDNTRGKAFISKKLYEELSAKAGKVQQGDILVTGGGTIGIPYVVPNNDPLYFKDADLICIQKSDKVLSRFLYHYFLSTKFKDYLKSITHDATIAHYTISQAENTPIPVPEIDVQKRIVDVLDNFDIVCNSLAISLPEEIDARKKQYEYYRDLLLSFADSSQSINVEREREREREQGRGARMR